LKGRKTDRAVNPKLFKYGLVYIIQVSRGVIYLSELRTLAVVALGIGILVGLTAFFIFHIPDTYSIVLGLASCVMFFFIILWSSYVFIFH
jgi:hypothetical protein